MVRLFVERQFQETLSRSGCLKYLHRLGFVLKRPKKRLFKGNAAKRKAFVELYVALLQEAARTGAKIFFVDEAHFRADADLRGIWVLQGEPALVDSTSPRRGENLTYYSAVCLETGEVEEMEVEEMEVETTCTAETSAAFLRQLRANHPEALIVIWDNGPAHHGEALRTFLATPDLRLRLVPLPGYSPDFNADEARPAPTGGTRWRETITRSYHDPASGPSAGRPTAPRGAPISGTRRAALGDRTARRQPAVCPRLLVRAARVVAGSLPRGGSVRGMPTAGPAGVAAQSRRAA